MAVESFASGEVHLDREAAAALRQMPLWDWFSTELPDDGPITLDLGGRWYRNIGRYLSVDLARAQEAGDVTGRIHVHCQDGSHAWEAATYKGRECWQGEVECFEEPVVLRRRKPVQLALPESLATAFGAVDGLWFFTQKDDEGEAFELQFPTVALQCACGGWDWRADRGVCGNKVAGGGQRLRRMRTSAE